MFFLLDTLKTTFWMEHLTQRWTQSGHFSQKGQGRPSLSHPSCAPVSVTEYASISLNMHKYPWNWINCSDYARVLNMPRYSYNNIIIIIIATNAIMLEFSSAQFIHVGALLCYHFFNKSWNKRTTKASKLLINFSFWLQRRQSFLSI